MIKILHLSDIHMGSGFSHGKINPNTGINTRLEDFIKTLSTCIDKAIDLNVDLVLFGGDAFPDATPPPYVYDAFAEQFKRLAKANIATILLVGNHDQHSQGNGGASLSIYRTLDVPGFIVGDRIKTHLINTPHGDVQVITIPWLTTTILQAREITRNLSLNEIDKLLLDRLESALEGEIRKLKPDIPTILLGHLMLDRASIGSERFLAVSKGFSVPVSLLIREEIDYVALGHVHKHQNLNPSNDPPIIYPGSIERVDFSEEKEDKGYVLIELTRGEAKWQFCPLDVRRFCTIRVDASDSSTPEATILKAIAKYPIQDAVVRLFYKLRSEQLSAVNTNNLGEALASAHQVSIHPEIVSPASSPRIPEFNVGHSLDYLQALATYIDNHEHLQDIGQEMLEAAKTLVED
ncbi:MAG: exonuclease subunit SbcD [Gloeocapsa sp. DLM2.Bin57]|nr:MAG: exonuclease subunit SbcD [Gloeocapsa sp. DLM2.Bin57]